MSKKKKDFVSNVTGEEWFKHNSIVWSKVINQIGVVKEDEVHQGKKEKAVTLKKGSRVIIDDIRGRIKPQYRVIDENGKIWFVSALNLDILEDKMRQADVSKHKYKGGVRHDGSEATPYRYTVSKTTKEELEGK
jgi:hypothetical protein|tara:strand:+ start:48 stop:449 length:402 start_codon:yes stop_codon:yes gene_type:complete